jgi:UDP-glucose 4-epimerase
LANAVLDLTGAKVGLRYEIARFGEINESFADISKARRLLGFQPSVVLRDGLAALV